MRRRLLATYQQGLDSMPNNSDLNCTLRFRLQMTILRRLTS
jgi:hypothetical protein